MSAAEELKISPEEYLERERAAVEKSEFVNGEVFVRGFVTYEHNVAMNLASEISTAFKDRPCVVLGSEMNHALVGRPAFP
jgi:hypothetical protein